MHLAALAVAAAEVCPHRGKGAGRVCSCQEFETGKSSTSTKWLYIGVAYICRVNLSMFLPLLPHPSKPFVRADELHMMTSTRPFFILAHDGEYH